MADAFVELLNAHGYLPVFARTGLEPPDVYTYERTKAGLAMRLYGDMGQLLASDQPPVPSRHKLLDIVTGQSTSNKDIGSSVNFMQRVLQSVGVSTAPKLDLSFTGSNDLRFAIAGISSLFVQPAQIQPKLSKLNIDGIRPELFEKQRVYVAYEYLFASQVYLERGDKKNFATAIEGSVGDFIDVGGEAKIELENSARMIFAGKGKAKAAFAMKVGRIDIRGDNRYLTLDDVTAGHSGDSSSAVPVLPRRNSVLTVIDDEAD